MKFNGNITLNALGQSEVQNLVVERVSATPGFISSEAGRLIYNTTARLYFMNSGLGWVALATGGDAASLQTEVDALEASIGTAILSSGDFNSAAVEGNNIVAASSITDAINQLDAAITGKNELKELLDVAVGSATNAQFLHFDQSAGKWVNHTLVLADVSDLVATATEVNFLSGVTSSVQDQLDAEAARAVAAEGVLTSDLGTEVSRALAAEAALSSGADAITADLATEVARATAAEGVNAAAVVTEQNARVAADAVVASNAADLVAAEADQRTNTDTAFGLRVDGVQAELDTTQAGAGLETDGSFVTPVGTTYLGAAVSLKDAAAKLDAAIHAETVTRATADTAFQGALDAETQSRVDGDANLQAQLTAYIDGAVSNNVNADNAETAARIAADAALQTELDATQVGAGLSTSGSYTADSASNYIKTAVSLANADTMLDSQIKIVADALASEIASNATQDAATNDALSAEITARTANDAAQQLEINAIETGAGLNGDGSYAVPTGTNFLNAAVSLKDADNILDSAVQAEIVRATAAEVAVQAAVDAEVARATAAEGANATAISDEAARAAAAEGVLTTNLASEVTRATAAEGANTTAIGNEVTRAQAAESAIVASLSKGYFLYDGAAAASHTVAHGIGSRFCNVTVIDSATNEQIIPQSVVFDSSSQLTVTFNVALACKVVVMGLGV